MTDFAYSPPHDDAADAARMLARVGTGALALGVPATAGVAGNSMAIVFAIGLALLFAAEALDPAPGVGRRFQGLRFSLLALAVVAMAAWALASLSWTPFVTPGLRRIGAVAVIGVPAFVAIMAARPHIRAADLYLFPVGVCVAMAATLALEVAGLNGVAVNAAATDNLAVAVVVMAFPAMAGLSARGRNGLARSLMVLALIYTRIAGPPAATAALLAGLAAFSFALSDAPRTIRDLGILSALLVLAAPFVPLAAPGLVHLVAGADIALLPQPGPALAAVADVEHGEPLRLLTGHGVEAMVRAFKGGVLPPAAPHGLVFQVWYDFGFVGAAILAFGLWRAFLGIDEAAPRIQPYLLAGFACVLTLAFTNSGWGEQSWVILVATAAIAADCALRGVYASRAPAAVGAAHF